MIHFSFRHFSLRTILLGAVLLSPLGHATEFRTTREEVIVYDSPAAKARRLSILSSDYPVEVLDRDQEGWIKVRDMSGDIGWIEEQSTSDRKRVIIRGDSADILRQPDNNARLAFRAEKGVILEQLSAPDAEGWLRVRVPNSKREGYILTTQVWGIERHKNTARIPRRDDDRLERPVYVVQKRRDAKRRYDEGVDLDRRERNAMLREDEDYVDSSRSSHPSFQHVVEHTTPSDRYRDLHEVVYRDPPVRPRYIRHHVKIANTRNLVKKKPHLYREVVIVDTDAPSSIKIRKYPMYKNDRRHHMVAHQVAEQEVQLRAIERRRAHELQVDRRQNARLRAIEIARQRELWVNQHQEARLRAIERARLRERRLRAERLARMQDQEQQEDYRRPASYKRTSSFYSTTARNREAEHPEDWNRSYDDDRIDDSHRDNFAPPLVHH